MDSLYINEKVNRMRIIAVSLLAAVFGSLLISSLFFLSMYLFATIEDALLLLWELKIWIVPLVFGFGLQVGLFAYMKAVLKHKKAMASARASVSASGGMSAVSMAACCAHHLTDILPFLGFAAVATFFSEYQSFFLALGISSNIIGVFLMLKNIIENRLFLENGIFDKLRNLNMHIIFRSSIVVSVFFALSVLIKIIIYNQ